MPGGVDPTTAKPCSFVVWNPTARSCFFKVCPPVPPTPARRQFPATSPTCVGHAPRVRLSRRRGQTTGAVPFHKPGDVTCCPKV
jgi:hypothetical protein